jgi:hypothetical protein
MHDRKSKQNHPAEPAMAFSAYTSRDAKLYVDPVSLDRAMGPRVLVSADRMRGGR